MKIPDREIRNLASRLSEDFRNRPTGEPSGNRWTYDVMRSVRTKGAHARRPVGTVDFISGFGDLAWRLTPAALVLLILFSVMAGVIDDSLKYQVTGLITADPVGIYDITSFFYGV